jgi:hypothetical protein
MLAHVDDTRVQTKGIGALAKIARGRQTCEDAVFKADGPRVIVNSMRIHSADGKVQAAGLHALREFSSMTRLRGNIPGAGPEDAWQAVLLGVGAPVAIVESMRGHTRSARIQEAGMIALKNIAAASSACKDAAVLAGAAGAVVVGIQAHAGAAKVRKSGEAALNAIAPQDSTVPGSVAVWNFLKTARAARWTFVVLFAATVIFSTRVRARTVRVVQMVAFVLSTNRKQKIQGQGQGQTFRTRGAYSSGQGNS